VTMTAAPHVTVQRDQRDQRETQAPSRSLRLRLAAAFRVSDDRTSEREEADSGQREIDSERGRPGLELGAGMIIVSHGESVK
jgi:hypothetical protein